MTGLCPRNTAPSHAYHTHLGSVAAPGPASGTHSPLKAAARWPGRPGAASAPCRNTRAHTGRAHHHRPSPCSGTSIQCCGEWGAMSAWTWTRDTATGTQTHAVTVYRHGTGFPYTRTCGPTGTRRAVTHNGAQGDMHIHHTWVTNMGHKGPTGHGGTRMGPRPPGWSLFVLFRKQEPHKVCVADLPVLLRLPFSEGGGTGASHGGGVTAGGAVTSTQGYQCEIRDHAHL